MVLKASTSEAILSIFAVFSGCLFTCEISSRTVCIGVRLNGTGVYMSWMGLMKFTWRIRVRMFIYGGILATACTRSHLSC